MSILNEAIREHLELKRQHGAGASEVKQLEDEVFGPAERPGEAPADESPQVEDPYAEPPPDMRPGGEVATAPPAEAGEIAASPEVPAIAADGDGEPAGAIFDHESAALPAGGVEPPEQAPAPHAQAPAPTPQAEAVAPPAPPAPETAEQPPPIPPEEPTPVPEPSPVEPPPQPAAQAPLPAAEPTVAAPTPPEPEPAYPEPEVESPAEADEIPSDEIPFADLDLSLDDDDAEEEEEEEEEIALPEAEEIPDDDTGPFAALVEDEAEAQPGGEGHDVLEETPDFLKDVPEHEELWFEQRPPKDFDFGD